MADENNDVTAQVLARDVPTGDAGVEVVKGDAPVPGTSTAAPVAGNAAVSAAQGSDAATGDGIKVPAAAAVPVVDQPIDQTKPATNGNTSSVVQPIVGSDAPEEIPLVTAMAADEKNLQDQGKAIVALQTKVDELTTVTNAQTQRLADIDAKSSASGGTADHEVRLHRLMRRVFGED